MEIVQSPDIYHTAHALRLRPPSLFLGGGISNCENWQYAFLFNLYKHREKSPLVVFNPRRDDFEYTDENLRQQTLWERRHIHMADAILLYFPKETLCPITLVELGLVLGMPHKELFIGFEQGYQKTKEVVEQIKLSRPGLQISNSIAELFDKILEWIP